MKKSVKLLSMALVVVMLCLSFAACGKTLSGTYSADFLGTGTELTFDGNKVTLALVVLGKEIASTEGTYKIEEDEITFDFVDESEVEDDDLKEILGDLEGKADFEEGDDFIKIGDVKFEKED